MLLLNFFHKLNVPFYCFHDVDVISEGNSINEYITNIAAITEVLAQNSKKRALNYYGELQIVLLILVTELVLQQILIQKYFAWAASNSSL